MYCLYVNAFFSMFRVWIGFWVSNHVSVRYIFKIQTQIYILVDLKKNSNPNLIRYIVMHPMHSLALLLLFPLFYVISVFQYLVHYVRTRASWLIRIRYTLLLGNLLVMGGPNYLGAIRWLFGCMQTQVLQIWIYEQLPFLLSCILHIFIWLWIIKGNMVSKLLIKIVYWRMIA